ncbi:MAG: HU family DNA-binding protein [Rhizobiaceae bacterium]|nr:HU family DNA-binding protein [Rhizobiaceae bacterium]
MNKNELISAVADKTGMTKESAGGAVDAVLSCITETMAGGGEVRLLGFGSFVVADRKATTARNPRTGEPIAVPASKAPKFKAGKALKEAVNHK